MNRVFGKLTIEGFRALNHMSIDGLGRVNLITGRNNTGKSSVLEALRILTSDASPSVIYSILRYREEDFGESEDLSRLVDDETLFQLTSLFSGFPQLADRPKGIHIEATGGIRPLDLKLSIGWLTEERDSEGIRRRVIPQQELFEGEGTPALVATTASGTRVVRLDRRFLSQPRYSRIEQSEDAKLQCFYVSPYGGERTANLGNLWDRIALSDREEDVILALRIIDPDIQAVSMVGGETPRQPRTAIVRSRYFSRPVPLRSFGDGLNRLFGIVLSLVNAKDGLLLIDEFENGMHHTVQLAVWRVIFRMAEILNVQVFATSHSWDTISTFQQAAADTPEDGVLIRLTRFEDDVVPTTFHEDELAVVTRECIEVR